MIPYDDLVVALQEWRALKGLPVAQLSGALTPPPVIAPPKAAAAPARPAAPAAPAPPSKSAPQQRPAAPPPPRGQRQAVQALDETIDEDSLLDDASLHEHAAEDVGNFAMQFDPNAALHETEEEAGESTSVGTVPARSGDMDATNPHGDPTLPRTAPNRNDDW